MLKLTLEEKLKIVGLVAEEEMETEIQQADEGQERIFEALVRINRTLTPATPAPPSTNHTVPPPTVPARTGSEHKNRLHGAKVKLSKLSLPHFNGDMMKWPTFWDSYESAIHRDDELTDVDKFNYLRSLLERTALEAIAGLTLSAMNYQEAVELLKKRFGN